MRKWETQTIFSHTFSRWKTRAVPLFLLRFSPFPTLASFLCPAKEQAEWREIVSFSNSLQFTRYLALSNRRESRETGLPSSFHQARYPWKKTTLPLNSFSRLSIGHSLIDSKCPDAFLAAMIGYYTPFSIFFCIWLTASFLKISTTMWEETSL